MAIGPSPFKILCKAANEHIWRQVRSIKSVTLKDGDSFGLLCWSCILELILIPFTTFSFSKVVIVFGTCSFFPERCSDAAVQHSIL